MSRTSLDVRPRALSGKQCRFLRRAGITPANLYGAALESIPLQVETRALLGTIVKTSRNTPVDLRVAGKADPMTAFIWRVQRHPVTEEILHVDFYHVEATRRMRSDVPVVLDNVNKGLDKLDRRMAQFIQTVAVECLPADLPISLHADAGRMAELGDEIRVKELAVSDKVTVLTGPEIVIGKILAIIEKEEEVVEVPTAEAAPDAEAAVEGEGGGEEGAAGAGEKEIKK